MKLFKLIQFYFCWMYLINFSTHEITDRIELTIYRHKRTAKNGECKHKGHLMKRLGWFTGDGSRKLQKWIYLGRSRRVCVQLIGARGEPVIYLWPAKKKNQRKYSRQTFISSNNKAASLLFLSQQVREKPTLNSRLMSNEKPLIEQKKRGK